MSSLRQEDHGEKQPRWQFRKKKKIEKRRNKRQMLAEKNKPTVNDTLDKSRSTNESTAEKQLYEQEKAHWEEKERKFNLIEVAKKKARQKEEEAKVLTQVFTVLIEPAVYTKHFLIFRNVGKKL